MSRQGKKKAFERGNDEPKPVLPPGDDPRAGHVEEANAQVKIIRCRVCPWIISSARNPLSVLQEHHALEHPDVLIPGEPLGKADPREAVNHPSHYGGDVVHETIKCLDAWDLEQDALLWNAAKYISRAGKKDPAKKLEDLEKAAFYLGRRIESLKGDK